MSEDDARRQSVQGTGRPDTQKAAGPPMREKRPDARPALRKPGHDPAIRHAAFGTIGGRQSRHHDMALPAKASLHQPRSAARDLRAVGAQIRAPAPESTARPQKGT